MIFNPIDLKFDFLGYYDFDKQYGVKTREFYLSKDKHVKWSDAAEYCRKNGGNVNLEFASLTMSRPSKIQVFITNRFEENSSQVSAVIHVNGKAYQNNRQKSDFHWVKDPSRDLGPNRWAKDQPDNNEGDENCLSIIRFSPGIFFSLEYGFADVSCDLRGQILCEKVID
jgi:hypothetical protein